MKSVTKIINSQKFFGVMKRLSTAICSYIFSKVQGGSEVPKYSGGRGIPAFTKLILCKLDDVALVKNLNFRIDISLKAE